MTDRIRAADLIAMLDRHYSLDDKPWAGVSVTEIQSPCATRRADYLYLPCTVGGGMAEIVGHEIKVSKGDVIAEVADPTKADAWLRYCTKWFLVVSDPALIDGVDVPDAWGVLAPPKRADGRRMTVVRTPSPLIPQNPERALRYVIKHMNNHYGARVRTAERRVAFRDAESARDQLTIADLRTRIAEIDPNEARHDHRRARVNEILDRLITAGIGSEWVNASTDDIVAAIADHAEVKRLAENMRHEISRTMRIIDNGLAPFEHVRSQIIELLERHKEVGR